MATTRRKRRSRRRSRGARDFDKKALWKSITKDQKAATRAKLQGLRAEIKAATHARRGSKEGLKAYCSIERQRARQRIETLRANLKQAVVAERLEARGNCERARRAPGVEIARLREKLAHEKKFVADMRRIAASQRARRPALSSARERRSESDDEVRSNIPPELAPMFERVKRGIKGSPRKSRTESFLEYVESHPREQYAGIDDATDRLVADLERQQRAGRRDPRRARRSRRRLVRRRRR